MAEVQRAGRRHTVARRVLLSYAIIMTAFALVAGWSLLAQQRSAREASLMRDGYLPLGLALRGLVANQDTWNTQLNHITAARNPADKRVWFETAMSIGRPKKFGEVRAKISRAFMTSDDSEVLHIGQELLRETTSIESFLEADARLVQQLFDALARQDERRAEQLRDELVRRGFQGKKRLSLLEQRVERNVDALLDEAKARARLGAQLLIALVALTVLIGLLMVVYARRVLRPLAVVTERAKAVAQGDLTPRPVLASNDEIGELSTTFEGMVSAIARANEQLLAAERLATIGKMAAHVTHEIRNPLSSIALNLELLEEDLDPKAAEARALLRAIGKEVDRLSALSGQYLSMARRQELRLEEEPLGDIVTDACEFMRADLERHGIRLTLSVDDDLPNVLVDDSQLKQALFNLLRNAREAMDGEGEVSVEVARAADGGVDVTVDDTGPGIDASLRSQLFEPFFTTKGHGTGLGLAITRQIVQAHGGVIACRQAPAGGTRFWIHLPEASAKSSGMRARAEDEQSQVV